MTVIACMHEPAHVGLGNLGECSAFPMSASHCLCCTVCQARAEDLVISFGSWLSTEYIVVSRIVAEPKSLPAPALLEVGVRRVLTVEVA